MNKHIHFIRNYIFPKLFFIIISTGILFSQNSSDIQKNIETQNKELEALRSEIKLLEGSIENKIKKSYKTTEILDDLNSKIKLTEKLVKSLNREEKYLNGRILITEGNIGIKLDSLDRLKEKMTAQMIHIYKKGKPSLLEMILVSGDWSEFVYRTQYLKVLRAYEQKLRTGINQTVDELAKEKNNLKYDLQQKKAIRIEKELEKKKLAKDKTRQKKYLNRLTGEKRQLEKELSNKQKMEKEIKNLLSKLFKDKEEMRRREEELVRIRTEQNKGADNYFQAMKKKLLWPVEGPVISQFGNQRNSQLNTITNNAGIDIKAKKGTPVLSVLDGMVTTITYLRGYGTVVIIDHGGSYFTVYAHIENITVHENDYIQKGFPLAKVSDTGSLDGAKLHFEVWKGETKLNPENWLLPQ